MKVNKILALVLASISLNANAAVYELERVNTYYAVKSDHAESFCFNLARDSSIKAGHGQNSSLKDDIYNTCMSRLTKLDTFTAKP